MLKAFSCFGQGNYGLLAVTPPHVGDYPDQTIFLTIVNREVNIKTWVER
jgi:hypothetical protein